MSKVYRSISERLESALATGTVPWRKHWTTEMPYNMVSRKMYRGTNVWLTMLGGFRDPRWLSFKQLSSLGGSVEGEKGTPIVFWNWLRKPAPTADNPDAVRAIPFLRYYTCWNAEQVSGVPFEQLDRNEHEPIAACDAIADAYTAKPPVRVGVGSPAYSPQGDFITMPTRESFSSAEHWYSTLFHEYGHSTGHPTRLQRFAVNELDAFGSASYSQEELVAELTAAYLSGVTGIERATLDNSAAYCRGWLRALQEDKRLFVYAAQQAQKAADYIRGISHEEV